MFISFFLSFIILYLTYSHPYVVDSYFSYKYINLFIFIVNIMWMYFFITITIILDWDSIIR